MSNEWTAWTSLGTPGETERFIALLLGKHHDGRQALFAGGRNRAPLRSANGAGSWSEWEEGIGDDTVHVSFLDLTVDRHADGRLAVFTEPSAGGGLINVGDVSQLKMRNVRLAQGTKPEGVRTQLAQGIAGRLSR